jgi:site-specific DNA-adenine methylase
VSCFFDHFFSFYGCKYQACKHRLYPAPLYDTIVEPFAGGAGYATNNFQRNVILFDLDPKVYGVWHYLIHAKASEIRSLPDKIEHIDDVRAPQEALWLIGFWLGRGGSTPRSKPTPWMKSGNVGNGIYWGKHVRGMIAHQVQYIRHWKVYHASYKLCPNRKATHYIDPPYQNPAGRNYTFNKIDYEHLGDWCKRRHGQVIVCEGKDADWLPFRPLKRLNSSVKKGGVAKKSQEVVWIKTDRHTGFKNLWEN